MPYNQQGQWVGGSGGGLLGPEDAVKQGLGGAAGLIGSPQPINYPAYVPSQGKAPSQQDYTNYTPNQPMAQIQTPNYKLNTSAPAWSNFTPAQSPTYQTTNTGAQVAPWSPQTTNPNAQTAGFDWQNTQLGMMGVTNPYSAYGGTDPAFQKLGSNPAYEGLMGGDYDALQKALTTPGEIAAQRGYEQGQNNLATQMGGQGLYGSSIMSNQARNALEQPYMDTLATNAANAASTRYAQQAADLQNKNQFGLNIYGQQMNENQAANQQDYNTWGTRLGEQQTGQQMGLQAQQANQSAYTNLQQLLGQQGLAQNAAGLDMTKMQTSVNQQNVANQLAQTAQANQLGLNYAQLQTDVSGENATRALQQATAQNALRSGDAQQLQGLMANQNLAQNQFGTDIYGKQLAQEQNMNQFNMTGAQLGMTQNQNVYNAGVSDAARQGDYNTAAMNYANQGTEQQRQWENAQALEQMQYQLAAGSYGNQQNTAAINQYLALAGLGAPLAAANQSNQTASNNAWINAGITGLGYLMQ